MIFGGIIPRAFILYFSIIGSFKMERCTAYYVMKIFEESIFFTKNNLSKPNITSENNNNNNNTFYL
jgi:hypothetical protein